MTLRKDFPTNPYEILDPARLAMKGPALPASGARMLMSVRKISSIK